LEILWGAEPPETAANTLQTYVSHLRAAIEPDRAGGGAGRLLVTRGPGYLLAVGPDGIDGGPARSRRPVQQAEGGRPTMIFFAKEAVRLAVNGVAQGVACAGCRPIPELVKP
jgi:hypothetical protein